MKSTTTKTIPDFTQRDRNGNLEIALPPDDWFVGREKGEAKPVYLQSDKKGKK